MKMKKKEMAMKEKKYDGFAIASFVLSLVGIIFFDYGDIFVFGNSWSLYYSHVIFLFSFIFGIIALKRIKKNKNLRGKMLAIVGIIISILMLIFLSFMDNFDFDQLEIIK